MIECRGEMANEFFVRCNGRSRRFTGCKSRFLQTADGGKGIASVAAESISDYFGSIVNDELLFGGSWFTRGRYEKTHLSPYKDRCGKYICGTTLLDEQ